MADWANVRPGTRIGPRQSPVADPNATDLVAVRFPNGTSGTIPRSQLEEALLDGAKPETAGETAARATAKDASGHQVDTFIRSAASAGTFGATDVLAGTLSPEYAKETRERREANTAGNIGGTVLGSLNPFGAGGLIAKGGRAVGGAVASRVGTGAAARVAGGVAQATTEGALAGAGTGVGELGLSEEPVTAERALAVIGGNALYGAAVGGGVGGAGALLGEAARAGKRAWQARAAQAADNTRAGAIPDDIAQMDATAARVAKKTELEAIEAQRTASAQGVYDKAREFDDFASKTFVEGGDSRFARLMKKTRASVRNSLDNPNGFARRKGMNTLEALEVQENALREMAEAGPAPPKVGGKAKAKIPEGFERGMHNADSPVFRGVPDRANIDADALYVVDLDDLMKRGVFELPEAGDATRVARIGESWAKGQKLPPLNLAVDEAGNMFVSDGRHRLRAAMAEGGNRKMLVRLDRTASPAADGTTVRLEGPTSSKASATVDEMLARNRALQEEIKALQAPPSSDRLSAIEAKLDQLSTPKPAKGMMQQAAEGAAFSAVTGAATAVGIPFPIAALAAPKIIDKALGMLTGRLGHGVAKSQQAIGKVAERFAQGAQKVAKSAPILSSQVLARSSFADGVKPRESTANQGELAKHYRAREAEIRSQVMMGPVPGKPVMRPEAQYRLHDRLQGLWAVQPKLADMVESAAVRRMEFLASKLPPRPSTMAMQMGPDRWHPPEMEMRKVARYIAACDDPDAIFERCADGTMSPEDIEVLREVYPEMLADGQRQIMGRLPELRTTLPYKQRLMLSLLFDAPVDPSTDPEIQKMLQASFEASEEPMPKVDLKALGTGAPPEATAAQRMSAAT